MMTEEEGNDDSTISDKMYEGRRLSGTRSQWEVTLLGLALVSGCHFYYWNTGLVMGSIESLLAVVLCISAYLSTILCIAEMSSALPFGGGLYGIVRVTMGPYFAYLVACSEMMFSIFYIASLLLHAGQDITAWLGISRHYALLFWMLLLMWISMVNIFRVKHFWRSNIVMMVIVILTFCIYYVVTIPCMDCKRYGGGMLDGDFNVTLWFKHLGTPMVMFDVLTILPMACGDACEPRKTIPRSFLWSFGIAAINAMLLAVVVTCNAPGISYFAPPEANALSYGYASGLHVTRTAAKLFGIPACIASTSAVTYVYSIQMRSMAESGLSLNVLRYSHGPDQIPYMALLVGAGLAFGLLCVSDLFDERVLWALSGLGAEGHVSSILFVRYVIDNAILANVTRRRRKQRTLPSSNAMNTPTLSPSPSDNHIQRGCLVGLSGAVAYMSRMFRIRKQMSFTANLSSTSMAVVKKSKLKKDENSYRDYIPEDDTKSAPYLPQREEERNATTSVYVAYDRNSIFNISSESIDCQVKNHPTYDYQSKQHPRSFRYQVAPDNDMMEDCVGPLP
eukprot:scaffold386_cov174-Ochromonas_danica.AAC.37